MKKILVILVAAFVMFGCGEKAEVESKNIDQIYAEDGIPVIIEEANPSDYKVEYFYTAKLSGLRQSVARAMMGGRIDKVHVKIGDLVKKDQVLVEFPEDAPSGQFQQAKAALEIAEISFTRMSNLYKLGGISKQTLDQTETQYKVAYANFDAVSQGLKVRAPINGYVTNLSVQETDGVEAETVLATISQTKKMKAKVWVTENEINSIEKGMQATVTWNNYTLEGKITSVDMAMDFMNNAFGVNLVFDNPENNCKSGVIGDVKIITYHNPSTIATARKSILSDDSGRYVYILQNNKAVKQYVKIGHEGDTFEILEGVKAGDKIIVEGLNLVYDGAKVKKM